MSWQKWVVIAWLVWSVLAVVLAVGKRREPVTPGTAAVSLGMVVVLIALVVAA